jgi:hypothetical protein
MSKYHINPGMLNADDDWCSGDEQWPEPPPSPKEPGYFARLFTRKCVVPETLPNATPSVKGVVSTAIIGLILIDITTIY